MRGLFSTTQKTTMLTEVHILTIQTMLGRQTLNNSLLFKHVIKFKSEQRKCRTNGVDMHGKALRQSTTHTHICEEQKRI